MGELNLYLNSTRSDSELMRGLSEGDCAPLGELYRRYGATVASVLNRNMPGLSAVDREDLCQEVFLAAFDLARRYRDQGRARAWLCGIALQKARQLRRQRWVRETLFGRFGGATKPVANSTPDALAEARVDVGRLLDKVPAAQREVLLLHVCEGLSSAEIAEALNISENTVWTRLHRARKAAQVALEDPAEEG